MNEEVENPCHGVGPWPAIIAAIVVLVILVGIAFAAKFPTTSRAFIFLSAFIFGVALIAIIYWFCQSGNHTLGWMLFLLPFLVYLSYYIGRWFASVTVPQECVMQEFGFSVQ